MRWSDMDSDTCSVARTLEILGDRWTILVLREVFNGVRRFDDIQTHIGVSRSVLSQRLSRLVEQGVLERRPYREPGDRVRYEYRLTELGRGLHPVMVAMMGFGDRFLVGPEGPPVVLRHRDCGGAVATRLVCEAGHELSAREVTAELGPGARPLADAG